jgi:hypothetical protein
MTKAKEPTLQETKEPTLQEMVNEKLDFLIIENNKLKKQTQKLECALARVAHHTGTENFMKVYGIDVYMPQRDDMRKWRG